MVLAANSETVDKGIDYLMGKIPSLIDFALGVVLALVVFFIGSRVIKWIRKIIRVSRC